jgi:hypothetical protein
VANPSGRISVSKHGVQHILKTTGRPVTAKFRRLDPDKFEAAKEQVPQDGAGGNYLTLT